MHLCKYTLCYIVFGDDNIMLKEERFYLCYNTYCHDLWTDVFSVCSILALSQQNARIPHLAAACHYFLFASAPNLCLTVHIR